MMAELKDLFGSWIAAVTTALHFITARIRSQRRILFVERDPDKWTTYGLQPLSFIHSSHSPFYPGLEKESAANLDYILRTQTEDGGWPLNWSWAEVDPAAWKTAEKEWRAVMTLEKLERLEGFHRIQRSPTQH